MKRWILKIVALASVMALIAAPALAAQQTRSQDGSCVDGVADQTQERLRDCDQAQDCDQLQIKTQAGEATQAQVKAQVQAGEPVKAQVQAQTSAGEAAMNQTMNQTQAQFRSQVGDAEMAYAPEWVQKMARVKKQLTKRAHIMVSSD